MRPAAILDIGSSKIVCLCGSTAVRGGTVVHGVGVSDYAGYESAEFFDERSLEEAIVACVREAEQMARIRIAYECGRDRGTREFVEAAHLLPWLKDIGNSRTNALRYVHYLEAIVAYHRFFGGREN